MALCTHQVTLLLSLVALLAHHHHSHILSGQVFFSSTLAWVDLPAEELVSVPSGQALQKRSGKRAESLGTPVSGGGRSTHSLAAEECYGAS